MRVSKGEGGDLLHSRDMIKRIKSIDCNLRGKGIPQSPLFGYNVSKTLRVNTADHLYLVNTLIDFKIYFLSSDE